MTSKTIAQIQSEGYDALVKALGPEDATRFIRSYDPGSGDYTKDRKKPSGKKPQSRSAKRFLTCRNHSDLFDFPGEIAGSDEWLPEHLQR